MTAPVLEREGWRFGGITKTTAAFCYRTDAAGVNAGVEISRAPDFVTLSGTVTVGALNAGNNYQATCYVTGLSPGTKYYARARADDGLGGVTRGVSSLHTAEFSTIADLPISAAAPFRIIGLGCLRGSEIGVSAYAGIVSGVCSNLLALDGDLLLAHGDIYYPDIGTTRNYTADYAPNAWYAQVKNVDDATLGRSRTNFITTMDGNRIYNNGNGVTFGDIFASMPILPMWDDHDRVGNNIYGLATVTAPWAVNKRTIQHQVGHECFMDLNRVFIESEGRNFDTEARNNSTAPKEWYYVDYPQVRIIVIDCQSYRDPVGTDSPTYKIISDECEAWIINLIKTNPKKFLLFCSPVQLDGDHSYLPSDTGSSWKTYSYQRDRILGAIWEFGNPERTLIYTSDSHSGSVLKYRGLGKERPPIYELSASNVGTFSIGNYQDWLTGVADDVFRIDQGEVKSATGSGGKLECMQVFQQNCAVIDFSGGKMIAQLVVLHPKQNTPANRTSPKIIWSRVFE